VEQTDSCDARGIIMSGFFNMEGPFYKFGSLIADIIILSFFWILFSLPFFTIGASTTALYYVMTRRISNREGYLFRDFWTSFKSNLKQTTIIWIAFLVLLYILYINITNIELIGGLSTFILPIQLVFLLELILCFIYIIPLNARFEVGLLESVKTAFFIANRHLLTSIACLIIGAAIAAISLITIITSLIAMGLYVYLTSFLFLRVFRKYRPELDQDPLLANQNTPDLEKNRVRDGEEINDRPQ